jgi:hypothetical protein
MKSTGYHTTTVHIVVHGHAHNTWRASSYLHQGEIGHAEADWVIPGSRGEVLAVKHLRHHSFKRVLKTRFRSTATPQHGCCQQPAHQLSYSCCTARFHIIADGGQAVRMVTCCNIAATQVSTNIGWFTRSCFYARPAM